MFNNFNMKNFDNMYKTERNMSDDQNNGFRKEGL